MDERLYTVKELSGILKLHVKTITRFIHEGKIKANKIGRAWMVTESELKRYSHAELAAADTARELPDYATIKERISVSAVIEITEQNSEEASRISNSLMAMLNSRGASEDNSRFDFFYYPESQKAKYIVYGSPKTIAEILRVFDVLSEQKP
ncbi:MAG: helix-turn-helix domain-containing protein [Spirochaetales bacterium]|nr:helix-turn-helix domain-containing protein [Spirochaetales bacterium]